MRKWDLREGDLELDAGGANLRAEEKVWRNGIGKF